MVVISNDKKALVLGSSGDIGSVVVRRLAKEGYSVAMHYAKNKTKVEELKKLLNNTYSGKMFEYYCLNFSSTQNNELKNFTNKLLNDYGSFDVVVNCSGRMGEKSFEEVTLKEVREVFDVNVIIPMMVVRDVMLKMKSSGGGVIVNVSSFVVKYGMGRNKTLHYSMSKAALENFTIGLSRVGSPEVRVNCVSPGITYTKMQEGRPNLMERLEINPLKRMATVDEIVDGIMFCINNKYLNSEVLKISGGE